MNVIHVYFKHQLTVHALEEMRGTAALHETGGLQQVTEEQQPLLGRFFLRPYKIFFISQSFV